MFTMMRISSTVTWLSPLQSPTQVGVGERTVAVGVKVGDAVTVAVFSSVAVRLGCGVAVGVALGAMVDVAAEVTVGVRVPAGAPVGVVPEVGTTIVTAPSTTLSWLTGAAPPHGRTPAPGTQVWSVASTSPTDTNAVEGGLSLSDHGAKTCSGMVPLAPGWIVRSMVSSSPLLGSGGIWTVFDPGAGVDGGP
jgi:hypothetical protein